jgi:hypothetical protein
MWTFLTGRRGDRLIVAHPAPATEARAQQPVLLKTGTG